MRSAGVYCFRVNVELTSSVDNEVVIVGTDGDGGDVADDLVGDGARASVCLALGSGLTIDVAKFRLSAVDESLSRLGVVNLAKRQNSLGLGLDGGCQDGSGSHQGGNSSEVHGFR